mmetsp:Transcript_2957/g.12088  ORF Transcript_2957/g.12088 Transcript_2957/m.12088 type:complete len:203 (+) Transcript_2957:2228-2836(+)
MPGAVSQRWRRQACTRGRGQRVAARVGRAGALAIAARTLGAAEARVAGAVRARGNGPHVSSRLESLRNTDGHAWTGHGLGRCRDRAASVKGRTAAGRRGRCDRPARQRPRRSQTGGAAGLACGALSDRLRPTARRRRQRRRHPLHLPRCLGTARLAVRRVPQSCCFALVVDAFGKRLWNRQRERRLVMESDACRRQAGLARV